MTDRYKRLWVGDEGAEYRKATFDRQSAGGTKPLVDNPTIEQVREALRRLGAKSVLEAGCGWGRLASQLVGEFDVAGCDISVDMLKLADPNLPVFPYDLASQVAAPVQRKWDAVFTRGVLHYLESDDQLVAAGRNLLALSSGKVILWERPEVCRFFYGNPRFECHPLDVRDE